jgi:uncharacterized protein YbgA (DUF1722 family)/uncharacterized protein YbbK (DUF523 family)
LLAKEETMKNHARPRVVVSRCLGFAPCRWNGLTISSDAVSLLKPFVDYIPVCPEMEIGLGVPREPVRIVKGDGGIRLVQSETERDLTVEMRRFTDGFLNAQREADGFILKERSPSCGMKNVKVYPRMGKVAPVDSRHPGFFGAAVLERFPGRPVEDEGRLGNFALREHFLTALFALARLRGVRKGGRMKDLVEFQADHKYLLMAYSQPELKMLGLIVANRDRKKAAEVMEGYEARFRAALLRPPSPGAMGNVLMHALGYFKDQVSAREKEFFLNSLQSYRDRRVPLGVPVAIIRSWIVRFGNEYLERQALFLPYPEQLIQVSDSGKGREIGR